MLPSPSSSRAPPANPQGALPPYSNRGAHTSLQRKRRRAVGAQAPWQRSLLSPPKDLEIQDLPEIEELGPINGNWNIGNFVASALRSLKFFLTNRLHQSKHVHLHRSNSERLELMHSFTVLWVRLLHPVILGELCFKAFVLCMCRPSTLIPLRSTFALDR